MLNFSQLLKPQFQRRQHNSQTDALRFQAQRGLFKPVVVWNLTYRCNLACIHCYASSGSEVVPGELTRNQSLNVVKQLARNRITYLIFSGGDPFISPHFFETASAAAEAGIPVSISTNGTLIKQETASRLKSMGVTYVGISLDGLKDANDVVRGQKGAFERALQGARYCREAGIKVGLRMTLMKNTLNQIEPMIRLVEEERFERIYFSHLVYSGRGTEMAEGELTKEETRQVIDFLIDYTDQSQNDGRDLEVVTGSNDTDGVYLYHRLKANSDPRADAIYQKLLRRGGNTSGEKILNIDNKGNVFPDQFWRAHPLGNLMERSFEEIWDRTKTPLVDELFRREELLEGRCSLCQYKPICRGNTRARAEYATSRKWASDPACYLTDEEIGV